MSENEKRLRVELVRLRNAVSTAHGLAASDAAADALNALLSEHAVALSKAEEEIAEWKAASGLERGGDPDGVRPDDLVRHIRTLETERDEADRQRVDAEEKARGASENHLKALELVAATRAEVLEEAATRGCFVVQRDGALAGMPLGVSAMLGLKVRDEIRALATVPPPTPEREMVREFHERLGYPVCTTPTMPSEEERLLRARLALEEALEFAEASGCTAQFAGHALVPGVVRMSNTHTPDLAAMAQENADLRYVSHGNDWTMGVGLEPFREVHRANMHKQAVPDGKAKKPPNWDEVRPDVAKVLRAEGWQDDCCARPEGRHTTACANWRGQL